jgi:type IV secretion system protein VirB5
MKLRIIIPVALLGLFASGTAMAQGIAVFDAANLVQAVQQVVDNITKINNQVQQITQLQSHLDSINGARNLGRVFDSPSLRNYVPPQAYALVGAIDTSGYAGMTGTGKALRDAAIEYNCQDLAATTRTACQAALARPYQYKGLLQDAMKAAAGRLPQVDALMNEIDATRDQKAIQEVQARISAESVLLAHEASQVQMLQAMADTDERVARSRDRERQYEALSRSGKISDYLH